MNNPAPAKAKSPYVVDVLFGPIIAGTPLQNAQLTPYSDLALKQKLPSRQDSAPTEFAGRELIIFAIF